MNQEAFERAVRTYWTVRELQTSKQLLTGRADAGTRGAVTGGAHLDALVQVFVDVFAHAGFSSDCIRQTTGVELPGYYRPTKKWDLVVIDNEQLVAAIEFKSQVGPSFGNNFNNRSEEAIGSASDVWRAYDEGTFGSVRPWLGYVFVLEGTPKSMKPVGVSRGVFRADPIFENTSYMDRYRIMCRRLVRERLYDAACFVVSSRDPDVPIHEPDPELGFANFVAAVAGRAAYMRALGS